MTPVVGFVGLGRMGRLMARNLVRAGSDLVVFNRSIGRAEEFVAAEGGRLAATPEQLAAEADVVVTMLADGDALVDVYTGSGGLAAALRPGVIAVDMGTSGPSAVAQVRAEVERSGGEMLDAPVSGSTPAAEAASLLIMVGGSATGYAKVEPLLAAMGEPVHVGPPGAGASLKLVVNSILYGLNQALAEGVVLAEACGVDPATTIDIVARSAAGAPLVGYRRAQYLDPYGAPVLFTLDLAEKDLRLVTEMARERGVPMPQAERTRELVSELVEGGEGDRDMGFVVEGARRRRPLTGEGASG